ncbi:MAG: isoprenylcysteine carboxylmethyltransferase family protein [bacterium]
MQAILKTLRENSRLVDRYGWATLWKPALFLTLILAVLLPAAGPRDYPGAWLFILTYVIYIPVYMLLLIATNPDLVNQRGRPFREGTKPFEFRFFVIWRISTVVMLLVAGLDVRYGWSHVSLTCMWTAFIVSNVFNLIGIWPMMVNRHFETTVRIQKERDHRVVDTGPYRFVRHPGYAFAAPYLVTSALILQSLWALLPTTVILGAFLWRTAKEDQMLHEELDGYREYAKLVRWRWIPGLW